ncbi:MAG: glycine zipper 2TM domain-containing protein [Sulfuricurvum sp.]
MKKILITWVLTASTILVAQDVMGGMIGGAIGGIIGNQLGGGNGKVITTITGATLGAMIGSEDQSEYRNNNYSYPTRVVYREVPQQIIYTQPRVIYVNSVPTYDNYNIHHCREYARYWNNSERHERHHDENQRRYR